ncbi:hypothetical protein F4778DRAFT_558763 [Xylariomycetidae sp. FL2044]|nr:hypothetical protein F4778DRAFT_558763 [Xylariomycetidae sp. FL2044]
MADAVESPRAIARAQWETAQKIRADMTGKLQTIQSMKKEQGNVNYTAHFGEVEHAMPQLRLACMQVVFNDFEYAAAKKVEQALWQAHVLLNGEYRKALSRLKSQTQVVQRRKLDKLYRAFLKTSQSFYVVYIQRLSGRFYIPELRQAAYGTDFETKQAPSDEAIPSNPLRGLILKSCQTTLVHLGDLARYRCQAADKLSRTTFATALDYYGLANTLDPEDGLAHHQMAVLYQLQGQHLDIVYHFHRAVSTPKAHELALGNLEREFKGLENTSSSRKGPAKDPSEAMTTWFVRLHAYFFQGEQFSQQTELEQEVLHRMEFAMKNSDDDGTVIRRMILTNISAYDVASAKVQAQWTITGSQSCQFLLRFNIRTVLILLRLLRSCLREVTTDLGDMEEHSQEPLSSIDFGATLLSLLPLLRVYISWIYVVRADVVQYQDYLEPYVRDVYRLLAETLTSLIIYVELTHMVTSTKYLLPEDLDALGLRPLGDRKLPLFLQVEEVQGKAVPKRRKIRKPRQIVFGCRLPTQVEAVWRIRDIIYCGVLLAGSAKFPLAFGSEIVGGVSADRWVYIEETPTHIRTDEAALSRVLNILKLGDLKGDVETPPLQVSPGSPAVAMDPSSPQAPPSTRQAGQQSTANVETSKHAAESRVSETVAKPFYSDFSEDSEMKDMVNKLVDPVEDDRPQSSQTQEETSYGMNSSTAHDIFGRFITRSARQSPPHKAIPTLPWDYFYTPTPHRSNSQGQNQLAADGAYVPRSTAAQLDGLDSSSCLQHLASPYNQKLRDPYSSASQTETAAEDSFSKVPGRASEASASSTRRNSGVLESVEMSKNRVLESLTSALYAQHGMGMSPMHSPDSLSNAMGGSAMQPQRSTSGTSTSSYRMDTSSPRANLLAGSYALRSASRQEHYSNPQSPPGPPGLGWQQSVRGAGSQFPRVSSPLVNHSDDQIPATGQKLPPIGHKKTDSSGLLSPQWPTSLQESGSANPSSLAFSHSSSMYGGTPNPISAAPGRTAAGNGLAYNATMPLSVGEGQGNRVSSARVQNQMRDTIGSQKLSPYEQQILQLSLTGHGYQQRPK